MVFQNTQTMEAGILTRAPFKESLEGYLQSILTTTTKNSTSRQTDL